jgi:AcrR family transcriptional regulator
VLPLHQPAEYWRTTPLRARSIGHVGGGSDWSSCEHMFVTRDRVHELLRQGLSRREIADRLGLSKATVTYHARRLGEPIDERFARRYEWPAIQACYDEGHSPAECRERFGCSVPAWQDARRRGALVVRPAAAPLEDWLAAGCSVARNHPKRRLFAAGLKENRCERCGLTEWNGERLVMALHHANGVKDDNRLENLVLLCPNCHSQTENFAGRNVRAREVA